MDNMHHEASRGKPIAQELIAKLQRRGRGKAAKLAEAINSSAVAGGLAGFHPAYAAYVYNQNQVSVMSEQLTAFNEYTDH